MLLNPKTFSPAPKALWLLYCFMIRRKATFLHGVSIYGYYKYFGFVGPCLFTHWNQSTN